MRRFLEKIFVHSPVHYILATVFAAAFVVYRQVCVYIGQGKPEGYTITRLTWYDSLSVAGLATILVGGLLLVAYWGSFDIFAYAFNPGRIRRKDKYKNFGDYTEQKQRKRAAGSYYFMPYFLVGAAVLLISCFFL